MENTMNYFIAYCNICISLPPKDFTLVIDIETNPPSVFGGFFINTSYVGFNFSNWWVPQNKTWVVMRSAFHFSKKGSNFQLC